MFGLVPACVSPAPAQTTSVDAKRTRTDGADRRASGESHAGAGVGGGKLRRGARRRRKCRGRSSRRDVRESRDAAVDVASTARGRRCRTWWPRDHLSSSPDGRRVKIALYPLATIARDADVLSLWLWSRVHEEWRCGVAPPCAIVLRQGQPVGRAEAGHAVPAGV